jgi:hypothetical protein
MELNKKVCCSCGSDYVPTETGQTICYLCSAQPDNLIPGHKKLRQIEGVDCKTVPYISGKRRQGARTPSERLSGLGFTGRQEEGHLNASHKRPPYIYKDKACLKCKKVFSPAGALKRYCDRCNPEIRAAAITRNNKIQRIRKESEINLTPATVKKLIAFKKEYGLKESDLINIALKYFEKYYLPVDAQIQTSKT